MTWYDQPATPAPTPPIAAPEPRGALGGVKRTVATAMLAVGLLVVGGVAAVNAADPSASADSNASTAPADNGSGGTPGATQAAPDASARPGRGAGHAAGDCPDKGGTGTGGGTQGSGSTTDNGSPSSPSTSDL